MQRHGKCCVSHLPWLSRLARRPLSANRAIQGVDQHLNLDELVAGPFGLVTVKRSGQHFRVCVPILDHALTGFLQRFKSLAHFGFFQGGIGATLSARTPCVHRSSYWRHRSMARRRQLHDIHIIGGRFNTFEYNTDLHHVYLPSLDTWKERAPLPTARSGHGVQDRGQISQAAVFGQMESYDPQANSWQSHASMTTPRHAVGATTIDDAIYVAGGGAVTGGSVQSSVHEAFTLGA